MIDFPARSDLRMDTARDVEPHSLGTTGQPA